MNKLLRVFTAGSVDDGKSTLIGRLLYDTKSIFQDQLDAISTASRNKGEEELNLALLTDGLRAEREQGITIDVAYRYFSTPKRNFIFIDTPGHIQYTRNMVTGASHAELGIILIDARHGILEQTIRHLYIADLLGIRNIIIAVNKMDLVEYSESVYNNIKLKIFEQYFFHFSQIYIIPISAKNGDNIINFSSNMPWYKGHTILNILETIEIEENKVDYFAMPVQYVLRPNQNYRGYAGQVYIGNISLGDEVVVLPSKIESKVKSISIGKDNIASANVGQSIALSINDNIDISRGDVIASVNNKLLISNNIKVKVCCFEDNIIKVGSKYDIMHNGMQCKCIVKSILKTDINNGENIESEKLDMNDIGEIELSLSKDIVYTYYNINKLMGSLIFIYNNKTIMGGIICL